MKHAFTIFIVLAGIVLLQKCYYDSEEYLYPRTDSECDTANITYSGSVKPILQNNCYGCHSNSTSSFGGNIRLEDYADVKIRADNGSLVGSITHSGGFSPMPKGAAKLQDCDIAVVQRWVEAGAPNN
jgi:hypothetical protein